MANLYSYSSCPTTQPYIYKTNMDMLKHWAELNPDKEAFVECSIHGNREAVSCKDLYFKCKSFGHFLIQKGVQKSNMLTICMANSLNSIFALLGSQFAGGINVQSSNNMADGSDVINTVIETDSVALILDAKPKADNWNIVEKLVSLQLPLLNFIIYNSGKQMKCLTLCSMLEEDVVLQQTILDDDINYPFIYPEDIAVYYTTSGSTGKPKLVGHTHFGMLNHMKCIIDDAGIDSKSIFFCNRPFGWMVGSPRTYIISGCTHIFTDTLLSLRSGFIEQICDIIAREKCNQVYLPGYMVTDVIASHGQESKFVSVKVINTAGERVTKKCLELIGRFCQHLCIWYGSTETGCVSGITFADATNFEDGIIGKPLPGIEMKILDEKGQVVLKGTTGELNIRSVYRFLEYKGMQEKFAEVVDKTNWFRTDDFGHMRHNGDFVMEGRTNDQISIGTMKYFPCEVEKVLLTYPGVKEVVAVPVPDNRLYSVVCACIVLQRIGEISESDLQRFSDSVWTDDALIKPKYFQIFDQFPRTSSGKLDKLEIAKQAKTLLGL